MLLCVYGAADQKRTILAVKIRPHIAHCIWDGKVKYIIRSTNEIKCACFLSIEKESDRIRLLVGTIDGNVWSLSLPMKSKKTQRINLNTQPNQKKNTIGMKRQRPVPQEDQENSPFDLLQDNPILDFADQSMDAIEVDLLVCFPGIQCVVLDSSGKHVVMTSSLQPTTVFIDFLSPGKSHTEIELLEIEGDESTELLVFNGDDKSSLDALYHLLPHQDLGEKLIILQGDQDGFVRHATIDLRTQKCEMSGIVLDSKEAVVGLKFISMRESNSSKANTLLVVGRNGLVTIMSPSTPLVSCRLHVPRVFLFEYIPFLSMGCFVAKGKCFGVHLPRLIMLLEASPSRTPRTLSLTDKSSELVFLFPFSHHEIGSISNDPEQKVVVLLTSTGQTHYFTQDHLQDVFKNTSDNDVSSVEPSNKIKALLHQIAELSTATTILQKKSRELDEELSEKHFALTFMEQFKKSEIHSWIKCQLSLQACSISSKTATVSCHFEISHQMRNSALKFVSTWWAHVQVSNKTRKTTQSFFFKLAFHPDGTYVKSITFPQHLLRSNDGMFTMKCSLLSRGPISNTQSCNQGATIDDNSSDLVELLHTPSNGEEVNTFSVPLVEETCLHVFQLSTVVIEDYKHDEVSHCGLNWWPTFKKDLIDRGLVNWERIEEKSTPNASAFEMTLDISAQIDSKDKAALLLIVVTKVMAALLDEVRANKLLPQIKRMALAGKIMLSLRSLYGSVTVLKFVHSHEDKVQLQVHASDPIDLCVIRILLTEKFSTSLLKKGQLVDLVKGSQLQLQYSYSSLDKAEQILMELEEKRTGKMILESDICHNEFVSNTIQMNSMEHGILETYYSIRKQLTNIII